METLWENRFAQRTQRMESSAIRELLKLTEQPDVISFAGGLPAPDVFPIEEFRIAANKVLKEKGEQALQYSVSEGYTPLRELIVEQSNASGMPIGIENLLIVTGSQQALDLLGKIFINTGDRILVEHPTYLGALQAWNAYNAEYITIPMDHNGMVTDALIDAMRSGPKFIYALPNFQNPSGVTMSHERRNKLVEIADHYGVPIVEDDPYGRLRYEGDHLPSILQIDSQFHNLKHGVYNGNVIYTSTFSKILSPGIRLAWVVAPPTVIRKMVQAKQGIDLHTSTLSQMIAYEVAKDGFLEKHIPKIIETYGERRDIMLGALDSEFPSEVEWTSPEGGLFLWGTLPEHISAVDVLEIAVKEKVAFVPGHSFFPGGGGHNTFRINFSNATPEMIRTGVSRLGKAIKKLLA
jgi:2-aminoadipate transaminase